MIHLIAKGGGYVAVMSAMTHVEATLLLLDLFMESGIDPVEMDVMEFDPAQIGGVLIQRGKWQLRPQAFLAGMLVLIEAEQGDDDAWFEVCDPVDYRIGLGKGQVQVLGILRGEESWVPFQEEAEYEVRG